MEFLYFRKNDGSKLSSAKIQAYQLYGTDFDDIELELKIINGKILIELLDKQNFYDESIKGIEDHIQNTPINWNNGYEFLSYIDMSDNEELELIADKNSDTFNMYNSSKNLQNIKKFEKRLKKSKLGK